MVNRYCIMYKYNSINHTNEKTEAFYCLKNNYDKEKTKYYTSSLSDNRNHIIVFSQYFRYRRQWKQVRAGRYKRLAADSRATAGKWDSPGTPGEVRNGIFNGNSKEESAEERKVPVVH